MSSPNPTTVPALTRRAILAAAPAAVAAGALPATAASPDSAEPLLDLWREWCEADESHCATEMEIRRLYREAPADVDTVPSVKCWSRTYHDLDEIDRTVGGAPAEIARMRQSGDIAKEIAADMLEKNVAELAALRPVLAAKIARHEEWRAETGLEGLYEVEDRHSMRASELGQRIAAIAPTTPAGFLVWLDVLVSNRGGLYDPDGNCGDTMLATMGEALEDATGLKLTAPARCHRYRTEV